jgi:prepilin-type N-terminal cleavage/methylation domain-containing protein
VFFNNARMNHFIKTQGFTLLELLIVIAFVAIIMAIGVPNFSKWKEKYEINGQAQKVYFDIMLARSTSVKNNNSVSVTFDVSKNLYKVHDDTNSNSIEDHGESIKSVNLENNVEFGYVPGLRDIDGNMVTSPIFMESSNTVTFNFRGQASKGGSIFLIHKNDIGISNNRLRSINILRATGAVEFLKYDIKGTPTPWAY